MPFHLDDDPWYNPAVEPLRGPYTPDVSWASRSGLAPMSAPASWSELPDAEVVAIESRTAFDAFGPMEQPATVEEVASLMGDAGEAAALLFGEDRQLPIVMRDRLPAHWARRGPGAVFEGEARPDEHYPFQVGVFALRDLDGLRATVSDLLGDDGSWIPAASVTCYNLVGRDWIGQPFTKDVSVPEGQVQALWFGMDVPLFARGTYSGTVAISDRRGVLGEIGVSIAVAGEPLPDHGDADPWRHSRLRWLNSTNGVSETPTKDYPPVRAWDSEVRVLGRTLRFGPDGLPGRISSQFTPSVAKLGDEGTDILARPIRFVAEVGGRELPTHAAGAALARVTEGTVCWRGKASAGRVRMRTTGRMEFDGHVEFDVTVEAVETVDLSDLRLEIPLRREVAEYMMGMGFRGGYRPGNWDYAWEEGRANHLVWLGTVNAGLQIRLRLDQDLWNIYNLKECGLPESWDNGGKGGCTIREAGDEVLVSAFSGARSMSAGEKVTFRFALLITPTKLIHPAEHWRQRYYHTTWKDTNLVEAHEQGATIVNLHQGNKLLPNINYPFHGVEALRDFVGEADDLGLKVKFYYTVRELSNFATELHMLRSLGNEILTDGAGFVTADHFAEGERPERVFTGGPWLCEHLINGYAPAWHQPLDDGTMDEAVATAGLSRWHNYYLEGLDWLIRNVGISGLYLDGIGYDRQVMKRVRRVMDSARAGCLIDFHSGDNFPEQYGNNSPASQYMEHFPFIDSLWLGEGYDYDLSPDFWLVEASGIPFGLMGEMLQGGGNPWRGMVYGMTNRLHWQGDPREIWRLWDEFGIGEAEMIGYWCPNCPVKTDVADVLATVYRKEGTSLISVASWHEGDVDVRLHVDWDALGMDASTARLRAPDMPGFQSSGTFGPAEPIPVPQGKGWLLIIESD